MRGPPSAQDRCSAFELPDIRALLQKVGCKSGRAQPGRRIAPLPSASEYPSILRGPDHTSTTGPRRVKFDLSRESIDSELTYSREMDEGYIEPDARQSGDGDQAFTMKYRVQQIPRECLRELVALGSLDRMLVVYGRQVGRLSVDSFRPFRSLYLHAIVVHHLSRQRDQVDFDDIANVCDAAVVLNNATVAPSARDPPSLLSFLDFGIEREGNLTMPSADQQASSSWRATVSARMSFARVAGHVVAHLPQPAVSKFLQQHIAERCIIRPVFDYMYRQFADAHHTPLPVRNETLQFQIYSTVREILHNTYGPDLPWAHLMYTTLYAIAETNERIASAVIDKDPNAVLCSTILSTPEVDSDECTMSSVNEKSLEDPLPLRELLCILDWDFAAVIGNNLAYRFHEANTTATQMRARLGALALGVDATKEQPFPPVLRLQDTNFHQYIYNHVSTVYSMWPHGFAYMVLDEAVDSYNSIIQETRSRLG
ncbi:hypothetical protein GGF46_005426 [Coemansia sp. RSA 552]|nr:hypothetical protein GGF46_005426 [Coemansia sp. RSA 552]